MRNIFIKLIPLIFVFLWSTGFIGAKYALPYIEPFYLLFIRMVLTIGLFVFLCIIFKVKWIPLNQIGHQMITGLLIHGTYLGGVFASIKWGMPAGITAIVVGAQPVLTAFLSWSFFRSRLSRYQWLGLWLGLIGVTTVLLSTMRQSDVNITLPALAAALSALAGISLGTVYQKRFGKGVNLLAGTLCQYISTALLMAIIAWRFETRDVEWCFQLFFALGWLVVALSVSAILLLMYMIREGEAAKVASYFYLVPPAASIEAWFLFGESLSAIAVAAIMVTVFGVYLVIKPPPQSS